MPRGEALWVIEQEGEWLQWPTAPGKQRAYSQRQIFYTSHLQLALVFPSREEAERYVQPNERVVSVSSQMRNIASRHPWTR